MRVTGFIMAVASFIYIIFLGVIATIKYNHDIVFFEKFPYFSDFANMDMVLFSLFVGGFVVSTTKYCEFFAGKSIGAKYLTSITSLQIIFVYGLEKSLFSFAIVERSVEDYNIMWPLLLVLLGNFIISMAGFIKDFKFIKKGEKQDTLANLDDNFMEDERDFKLLKLNLANLLTLYDKDSKKLAEEIKINRITLDNIINYNFDEQKVPNKVARKVNNFASSQVGNTDKLTKAYNRYYLDHKADELIKNDNPFKLYFLDLNKFKPINDEYGHEVGDYVLTATVAKLNALKNFYNYVFRVGGDEFVLLQISNMENNLEELITDTIELPVEYNGMQLQISTSIGRVHSDDYETLEDMLKDADELMFKHKNSKGVNR
jgi:diguanylate cyclase (GGDEF)-like protein